MAKINIKDLIGGAVENALARREEALTIEETNQIQGGISSIKPIVTCGIIKWEPPIVIGKIIRPAPIKNAIA
jgi:hypothetical protein